MRPPRADAVGIYDALARRVDLARYRPVRIADVAAETLHEGEQLFTVLRSPRGSYLRLSPAEAEIWRAMDGSKSIAELATMGFLRFGQLLPVAGLVRVHNGFPLRY